MHEGFQSLTEQEYQELVDAISKITILIANADGKVQQDEVAWAKKVTEIRSYKLPDRLKNFYKDVGKDFENKLKEILDHAPDDVDALADQLVCSLERLNPILQKLDNRLAFELYSSFKSFAKHVAKASGGFLGFGAINSEEYRWVDLPMLNEISLGEDPTLI